MTTGHTTFGLRHVLVLATMALVAVGLAVAPATAAATSTKTVKLGDNFFNPKKLTVTAGTTINFKFTGSNTHNVTVVSGPEKFHSSDEASGTYTHTVTKPGTYKIVCTFHPGMTMTLKVKKASGRPPPTTSPPPSS